MSFDRRTTLINPPASRVDKPKSKTGFIIGLIILSIVVITLIVIVIILLLRPKASPKSTGECVMDSNCSGGKICVNGKCLSCKGPPKRPESVNVVFDSMVGSAELSWAASIGATSYNIYRKLEDPSVGVNNFNQKEGTASLTRTFTTLVEGTHYFVVTALNDCGESQPSNPVILVPSCSTLPVTMTGPVVTQDTNDCAGIANADIVNVSFSDMSIDNGVYVIQGTGQKGNVSPYLYLVQGSFWSPASGIHLECGGVMSTHTVMQITEVQNAELTVTGSVTAGNTFDVTWNLVAGMEQYVVFLVGMNVDSVPHFYGGFAGATNTSLTLLTNSGDNLIFALVLGFRLCNKSNVSSITNYITDI